MNGPVHSAISELIDSVDTLLVLFKETNKCNTQIPTSNNRFVPLFFSLHPFSTIRVSGNLIATDDFENGLLQQATQYKMKPEFLLYKCTTTVDLGKHLPSTRCKYAMYDNL